MKSTSATKFSLKTQTDQQKAWGGVLQEASQSGKLDEALELLKQEQQEVMRAAPEEQSRVLYSAGVIRCLVGRV